MAHQASYRRYRPRRFSEVEGQDRTIATLREAVRQSRLAHAYLFSGPRGTGKTSVARILAKAVNCENLGADGDPCLECSTCLSIDNGQNLDVIEIDAASNRGIDEIRDIKERVTHQTAMSRYKVYIIDEVHMLTAEAFNAFLKTLEEPPAHALFVLATTEAPKLPVTVLSRCQRYEFKRLSVPVISHRIRYVAEQETVSADPQAIELLAEAADGALRDALSLFDQVVAVHGELTVEGVTRAAGFVGQGQMRQLLQALGQDVESVVGVLTDLRQDGLDERLILRDLARQLRDLMVFRTASPDLFPPYRRAALKDINAVFPDHVPAPWWIEATDQMAQADARLRGGFPPDLALELACLRVQQALLDSSPSPAPQRSEEEAAVVLEPHDPPSPNTTPPSPGEASFSAVLELVKRDRPTTYALFEKTSGHLDEDGVLTIRFEFPAHRELMDQAHNRDVVDRAIKSVFGPQAQYRFVDGAKPLARDENPDLKDALREWFGDQVSLTGFDDQNSQGG